MNTITDWGTAMWLSLVNTLGVIIGFIPKIIGFLIILLIGWLIAKGLQKAVTFLLNKVGFERISDRMEKSVNLNINATDILGKVVFWFVFLIFLVPATDTLGLASVSVLVQQIVAYIPNVFVAILVLCLGVVAGAAIGDAVHNAVSRSSFGSPRVIGNITKYAIIGFAALIALVQLNVAESLINILFTAIVGSLAIAFGLAFGLGGRDSAQRVLNSGQERITSAAGSMRNTAETTEGNARGRIPAEQGASTRRGPSSYNPRNTAPTD